MSRLTGFNSSQTPLQPPAGLGDGQANIQLTTSLGRVALKDMNSPFKATGQQGIYKNSQTGETLRVSSQGVFGDTWLLGKHSDQNSVLNYFNNELAQVGRRTYVERFNAENQLTRAYYYRANDQGKITETKPLKPAAGQTQLSDSDVKTFRKKTQDGISEAQFHNNANGLLIPAGFIGLFFAALFGGAYVAGAVGGAASGAGALAGGAATTATVGNALLNLPTLLLSQMSRLGPMLGKVKALLQKTPQAFKVIEKAVAKLAAKFNMPQLKLPALPKWLKWLSIQGLTAAVWDVTQKLALNPAKGLLRKIIPAKPKP